MKTLVACRRKRTLAEARTPEEEAAILRTTLLEIVCAVAATAQEPALRDMVVSMAAEIGLARIGY